MAQRRSDPAPSRGPARRLALLLVAVTIGAAIGDAFEVLSGLAAGDEVVVRGNERLRPGQDIAPSGGDRPPGGASSSGEDAPAAKADDGEAERG